MGGYFEDEMETAGSRLDLEDKRQDASSTLTLLRRRAGVCVRCGGSLVVEKIAEYSGGPTEGI